MGTLEFSIYTKSVFDTQEGICHLGERLSQLFCLEMKKMESQLNNRPQVYKGLFWGKWWPPVCPFHSRRRIRLLLKKEDLREADGKTTGPWHRLLSLLQISSGISLPEDCSQGAEAVGWWPLEAFFWFHDWDLMLWGEIGRVKAKGYWHPLAGPDCCLLVKYQRLSFSVPQFPHLCD